VAVSGPSPAPGRAGLLALAFVAGFAVMAAELSAPRLLAPYFGASPIVWTNVIGVILAALAAGYHLGGRLADRQPDPALLGRLLVVGGIGLALIPYVARPLGLALAGLASLQGASAWAAFAGSLAATACLFAGPVLLLGMTGPFLARVLTREAASAGSASGAVFALATLGSLLGAYLPTLVLIPAWGTRRTILASAALLVACALVAATRRRASAAWVLFLAPSLATAGVQPVRPDAILAAETSTQYLQVVRDGERLTLLMNEGRGAHSIYTPEILTGGVYYDYYLALPFLAGPGRERDVLVLGLAGGTMSTQYHRFLREAFDLRIEGVEVDPGVIDVGRRLFHLENPSLSVRAADARAFLATAERRYAVVILDAFTDLYSIPFHMTTREFFGRVRERMTPAGVLGINVTAPGRDAPFLQALAATLRAVFPAVYAFSPPGTDVNHVVIAAAAPLLTGDLEARMGAVGLAEIGRYVAAQLRPLEPGAGALVLTDDRAPVEFLAGRPAPRPGRGIP
jgi:spermidine synthase